MRDWPAKSFATTDPAQLGNHSHEIAGSLNQHGQAVQPLFHPPHEPRAEDCAYCRQQKCKTVALTVGYPHKKLSSPKVKTATNANFGFEKSCLQLKRRSSRTVRKKCGKERSS